MFSYDEHKIKGINVSLKTCYNVALECKYIFNAFFNLQKNTSLTDLKKITNPSSWKIKQVCKNRNLSPFFLLPLSPESIALDAPLQFSADMSNVEEILKITDVTEQ